MMRILASALLILVCACSVKQLEVQNNPPETPERVAGFSAESGELRLSSLTAFLWPEFSDSKAARKGIKTVTASAAEYDRLSAEGDNLQKKINESESEFKSLKCLALADFGAEAADEELDFEEIEFVAKWKSVEPNSMAAQTLERCQMNQDSRVQLQKSAIETRDLARTQLRAIESVVDIKYPFLPDTKASFYKINIPKADGQKRVPVSITIFDFVESKNDQSTDADKNTVAEGRIFDATYDFEEKMLRFKVPEIKAGRPTGSVFHFSLDRANFLGYAKFAGDMNLVLPNGQKRFGIISMYGTLIEPK